MGDEAEVLGEDVDIVLGFDGDADFEFTGEVFFSVDGVFGGFGVVGGGLGADGGVDVDLGPIEVDFFAVEPDIGVGGAAPEEALAEFFGEELGVLADAVLEGGGGGHGIADDVAAGAHGGEAAAADAGDDGLEVAFEDAVELDALAVGEAEGAFGEDAEVVVDEPLLGGDAAAGHFGADHEAPGLFLFFLVAGGAEVAVVLLVAAVELEEDVFGVLDVGQGGVGEVFGEVAAEAVGCEFDFFDAGFGHGGEGLKGERESGR